MPTIENTLRLAVDATKARNEYSQYVKSSEQAQRATSGVDTAINRVDKSFSGLGVGLSKTKVLLGSLVGGFAALQTAMKGITTIASFEATMSEVLAISGATTEEFQRLSVAARDMGATTKFSATEAGQALVNLAKAGLDANSAIAALPATLQLAQAGGLGLNEASDITTKTLSQFGLAADQASRIADVFAMAANKSNVDVQTLGEGMKFAGPLARSFGKSVEEVSAALGVLGDAGLQGAMGGTAVRQIMATLADPTKEARTAIQAMGLSLKDLNPSTNNLVDIFTRLNEAGMGANESLTIFSSKQASAALALSNSLPRFIELIKALENSEGSAKRVADIMDNNLRGAFKSFQSSIEEAYLKVGDEGLLGALRGIIDTSTNVVRVFIGMEDSIKSGKEEALALARALEGIGAGIAAFIAVKAVVAFAGLSVQILACVTSFKALTLALAANPLGLIASAISAAIAALVIYRDELITIEDTTASLGDFTVALWDETVDTVIRAWDRFIDKFESVLKTAKNMWNEFSNNVSTAFEDLFGIDNSPNIPVGQEGKIFDEVLAAYEKMDEMRRASSSFYTNLYPKPPDLSTSPIPERSFLQRVADRAQIRRTLKESVGDFVGPPYEKPLLTPIAAADIGEVDQNLDQKLASQQIDAIFEALKREHEMIGMTSESREVYINKMKLMDIARQAEIQNIDALAARYEAEATAIIKATEAADAKLKLNEAFNNLDREKKMLDFMEREGDLLKMTNEERQLRIELFELEELAIKSGEKDIDGLLARYEKEKRALIERQGVAKSTTSQLESVADSVGNAFGNMFTEMILGAKSVEEAFLALGNTILNALVNQLIAVPIASAISSVLTAPFMVPRFADGGIVGETSMYRGKMIGEAGPEAILPLKRGINGELGVASSGGGSTVINMHILTPDADSFRRSNKQISGDLRRMIGAVK